MATGNAGAQNMRNLPAGGSFAIDPVNFARMTERNDLPMPPITFPGFGAFADARINNVGVVAGIRLRFRGTLTTTGATVTLDPTAKWPHGIISALQISANGQNNLINVDGTDLKARWLRVNRCPATPPASMESYPTVATDPPLDLAGTAAVEIEWEVPIAHDIATLIGALFAQSDETYLNLRITTANQPAGADGDLFDWTAGSVALAGTFYPTVTFFEVPMAAAGQAPVVVLPDLSQLHGLAVVNTPVLANGETVQNLLRTTGVLTCLYHRVDNGHDTVDLFDPDVLTRYRLRYGGNQVPRDHNGNDLAWQNLAAYDGLIQPNVNSTNEARYLLADFEVDNPMRDVVLPKGVQDLQSVFDFAGETWDSAAQVHTVMETLFAGA